MISTRAARIWTPFGYLFADDLYIGEKVISFNEQRGVCEYDEIQAVEIEYRRCMGFGVDSKSMRQLLTPDHPILIWDRYKKTLDRIPIEDRFMVSMSSTKKGILSNAIFEPYKRSRDVEDLEWSARIASTMAKHRFAPLDIKGIVSDLGGYEAQIWLDTFFHWNKLIPAKNWMKSVDLNNLDVRDVLFNVAPRAGVGAKYHTFRGRKLASITTDGMVYARKYSGWYKQEIDGTVFNLTTKNGNVLTRSANGTFLIACNKGEK